MNTKRPDFDDIRLNSDDTDIENLDHLENLDTLDDLDQDLLDDDMEDPAPRPKKRKSMSLMTLVLLLVLVVVGGAFMLLNNDSVTRAVTAPSPVPAMPAPLPSDVVSAPVPEPAPAAMPTPEVTDIAPPPQDFADLPQPAPMNNDADVAAVGPVPDVTDAQAPVPVDPKMDVANALPVPEPVPEAVPTPAAEAVAPALVAVTPETVPAPASAPVDVQPALSDVPSVPAAPVETPTQSTEMQAQAIPAPVPAPDMAAPEVKPKPKPVETKADAKVVDAKDMGKPAEKLETVNAPKIVEERAAAKPVDATLPPPAPTAPASPFYEETEMVKKLSDATKPRLVIPDTELDRGLGVSVGDSKANDPEGAIAAAARAVELGRYETALDMYEKLYKKNKRDERILMGRAVSLQRLGRSDEAIRAYDELLAINPNNPDVATNMLGLVRQQNPSVALQRLLELRARYPQNATVAAQTGLANASVGNLEEGLRYLSIAASLEPENPKHYFNMGIVAEKLGKPDAAIAAYEKALTADATSDDDKNRIDRDVVYDRLSVLRQR